MKTKSAVLEPVADTRADKKPKRQPRYHVILWDDNDHSYDYVIDMMQDLFAHPIEKGMQIAKEVDASGRAICLTTTKEHAELKRDQIHAFGRDALIERCAGAMWASIEPETSDR
jgi:ATP-dependent Clp protease adaptor protein ClpS